MFKYLIWISTPGAEHFLPANRCSCHLPESTLRLIHSPSPFQVSIRRPCTPATRSPLARQAPSGPRPGSRWRCSRAARCCCSSWPSDALAAPPLEPRTHGITEIRSWNWMWRRRRRSDWASEGARCLGHSSAAAESGSLPSCQLESHFRFAALSLSLSPDPWFSVWSRSGAYPFITKLSSPRLGPKHIYFVFMGFFYELTKLERSPE